MDDSYKNVFNKVQALSQAKDVSAHLWEEGELELENSTYNFQLKWKFFYPF